jgi:hypothetical protein
MIQCGQNFRFALKAADACRLAGKLFRQDLDGDIAFELGVGRPIDLSHAARAQVAGDLIVCEFGSDHGSTASGILADDRNLA